MFAGGRLIRSQYHLHRLATQQRQHLPHLQQNLHRQLHCSSRACLTPAHSTPTSHNRRAAIDPVTLFLATAVSAGIAYVASTYVDSHTVALPASTESESSRSSSAPAAQELQLAMASQMPPGRPGNLTPDQEAKLKEMWHDTLEVFGVTHDHKPSTSEAETASTAADSTETKKKRKSRLSLFGKKKGKEDAGNTGDGDNDKHGQTREYQQALSSQTPSQLRDAFWSMTKHDLSLIHI